MFAMVRSSGTSKWRRPVTPQPVMVSSKPGSESAPEVDPDFEELASEIHDYLSSGTAPDDGPLAFVNLRRAGRTDIMSGVIRHGGSIRVAQRMGIEPILFVPPLQAVESKTFPDFYKTETGASLALGRDLDVRLDAINTLKNNKENATQVENVKNYARRVGDRVPSAEELVQQSKRIVPPVVDDVTPTGETLALSTAMRVGVVIIATVTALGYGRTSSGIFDIHTQLACRSLANGLLAAHVILAAYVAVLMAPQLHRSSTLWLVKVLLSGPLGFRALRALGPVEKHK